MLVYPMMLAYIVGVVTLVAIMVWYFLVTTK